MPAARAEAASVQQVSMAALPFCYSQVTACLAKVGDTRCLPGDTQHGVRRVENCKNNDMLSRMGVLLGWEQFWLYSEGEYLNRTGKSWELTDPRMLGGTKKRWE